MKRLEVYLKPGDTAFLLLGGGISPVLVNHVDVNETFTTYHYTGGSPSRPYDKRDDWFFGHAIGEWVFVSESDAKDKLIQLAAGVKQNEHSCHT